MATVRVRKKLPNLHSDVAPALSVSDAAKLLNHVEPESFQSSHVAPGQCKRRRCCKRESTGEKLESVPLIQVKGFLGIALVGPLSYHQSALS